jgi:hypothetical protein
MKPPNKLTIVKSRPQHILDRVNTVLPNYVCTHQNNQDVGAIEVETSEANLGQQEYLGLLRPSEISEDLSTFCRENFAINNHWLDAIPSKKLRLLH